MRIVVEAEAEVEAEVEAEEEGAGEPKKTREIKLARGLSSMSSHTRARALTRTYRAHTNLCPGVRARFLSLTPSPHLGGL
jgi:hypothetical protein